MQEKIWIFDCQMALPVNQFCQNMWKWLQKWNFIYKIYIKSYEKCIFKTFWPKFSKIHLDFCDLKTLKLNCGLRAAHRSRWMGISQSIFMNKILCHEVSVPFWPILGKIGVKNHATSHQKIKFFTFFTVLYTTPPLTTNKELWIYVVVVESKKQTY